MKLIFPLWLGVGESGLCKHQGPAPVPDLAPDPALYVWVDVGGTSGIPGELLWTPHIQSKLQKQTPIHTDSI